MKYKGQLNEGDVFMSCAGNLPCQRIAHALGPVWKGGAKQEETSLKKAINTCLRKTEKKNYSTIAIPALSTGGFHYPADRACDAIVEQVIDYFKGQRRISIRKVILCDINVDTVKCFIEAVKRMVKDVKVHCK